eukprot:Gb_23481 [translate_table: standard]
MAVNAKVVRVIGAFLLLSLVEAVTGTVFTLVNNCAYTVWPGVLTGGGGGGVLEDGGLTLEPGQAYAINAPAEWSGRFWGRTGCTFDPAGAGSCSTGDCGGVLKCDKAGGVPPVTLAEFTLGDMDFYDVSLVDGYNVPLSVTALGGSGDCGTAGCVSDLRAKCPSELTSVDGNGEVVACKSACAAFGTPQYCCTGDYGSPQTCSPSLYSQMFKTACPTAYSYAYDDSTSTFTCSGSDYRITFCSQS